MLEPVLGPFYCDMVRESIQRLADYSKGYLSIEIIKHLLNRLQEAEAFVDRQLFSQLDM